MKKSDLFNYAQRAVVEATTLTTRTKLEILRELMKREDVELFIESHIESHIESQEEKDNEGI